MSSPPKRRSRSHPRKSYQPRRTSLSPSEFGRVIAAHDGAILQQLEAGLLYIKNRYGGSWLPAGSLAPGVTVALNATGKTEPVVASWGFVRASWPKGGRVSDNGFSAEELPLTIGSYQAVRYWTVPKNLGRDRPVTIAPKASGPGWVPVEWVPAPRIPVSAVRLHGMQRPWEPGENIAHCTNGCPDDEVPVRVCGCGFWAYWEAVEAGRHMGSPDVVGVVEGYGHVIAGARGLRCAKTRVVALCVLRVHSNGYGGVKPRDTIWRNDVMTALHEVYGVPIYDDQETMLRAHPPSRGRVAEWAAARPQDAEKAQQYALKFPLGQSLPEREPERIPCVICGQLAPGGATCDECSRLASLATRLTVWFKCGCGAAREVSLEVMDKAKGDVSYSCHCGVEMAIRRPTITPAEAMAELKRRAGGWTVH